MECYIPLEYKTLQLKILTKEISDLAAFVTLISKLCQRRFHSLLKKAVEIDSGIYALEVIFGFDWPLGKSNVS